MISACVRRNRPQTPAGPPALTRSGEVVTHKAHLGACARTGRGLSWLPRPAQGVEGRPARKRKLGGKKPWLRATDTVGARPEFKPFSVTQRKLTGPPP